MFIYTLFLFYRLREEKKMQNRLVMKGFVIGIIVLLILSASTPMVFGINTDSRKQSTNIRDPLEDYYGVYSLEEIPEDIRPVISDGETNQDIPIQKNIFDSKVSPVTLDGLMDSAWPMYCHDTRHTGRSPYSTADNPGLVKWLFYPERSPFKSGIAISVRKGIS